MKFRVAPWIAPVLAGVLLIASPAGAEQQPVSALRRPVTVSVREAALVDALRQIADQAGFRLSYNSGALPAGRRVSLDLRGVPAEEALRRALAGSGFTFREAGGQVTLVPVPRGTAAPAQEAGRVTGRVLSARTGEPVAGARVSVTGTQLATETAPDGRYALPRVPAGTREVRVERLGYAPKSVTGVQVAAGRTTELDVGLESQTLVLEGLTVTAEQERGSTGALLRERRLAPTVVDVVGRQQIERSPDADAAQVLRRLPSAEVREGKFVYIRGLGDRYGNVTLNGTALPSLTPDRKSVPLDVIPSNLLEAVVTSKGYTPDLPGDFAGGLVQLRTRDVPPFRVLKITTGMGYNTATTGQSGWLFRGCSDDWTGFGSCTDLPELPADTVNFGGVGQTREDQLQIARAYAGTLPWAPSEREMPLNRSFELTYGDQLTLFGSPVGAIASVDWSDGYSGRGDYVSRTVQGNVTPGVLQYITDYSASAYGGRDVSLGALGKLSFPLGSGHRVSVSGILNRLQEDRVEILEGYASISADGHFASPRLARVQSTLWNVQLEGEHHLGVPILAWRAARIRTERYEPGSRAVLLRGSGTGTEAGGFEGTGGSFGNGPYTVFDEPPGGRVLHGDMDETAWAGAVDLTLPFRLRGAEARLKVGGALDRRDRDAFQRTLLYRTDPAVRGLPLDSIFSPENIGTEVDAREFTRSDDSSVGESSVYAGYAMLDLELLPRLRVVGGARLEAAEQEVRAVNLFDEPTDEGTGGRNEHTDLLPALNLTYAVGPRTNLRAGFSRTVARPQFREIATFFYTDYFGGISVQGNTGLHRTLIDNADLRWEFFPQGDAVISAGVFFKRFHGPIEPLVVANGFKSLVQTWINTREADTWGMEAELRTRLGFVAAPLDAFTVSANYARLHTEVDSLAVLWPLTDPDPAIRRLAPETRSIFGQTPYLLNVGLTYEHPRWATTVSALFNRSGKRLELASAEPIFPSVYELPRNELDVVVEQGLWRGMSVKASGSRLLGSEVRYVQDFDDGQQVTTRAWDAGRTFSFSLSWEPGQ